MANQIQSTFVGEIMLTLALVSLIEFYSIECLQL